MPTFPGLVFVGIGVKLSFDDLPKIIAGIKLELEKPLAIGGKENKFLMVRIHNFDPTLAAQGNTVSTCEIESDYAYWESLRKDIKSYNAEKERITNEIISVLEKRFPGLAEQVEMHDVATPVTYYRYTGNWRGSYEGWLPTPKTPPNFLMSKTFLTVFLAILSLPVLLLLVPFFTSKISRVIRKTHGYSSTKYKLFFLRRNRES